MLFRTSAWGMVVAIVIGTLTLLPGLNEWAAAVQRSSPGREYVATFLVAVVLDAVVLWISAIRHALRASPPQRGIAIALLFTNFVGALFYFFLAADRSRRKQLGI